MDISLYGGTAEAAAIEVFDMKTLDEGLLALYALVMGACAGGALWLLFELMGIGTRLVWQILPERLALGDHLAYYLLVCMGAGALIGLLQKYYGAYPDTMPGVMVKVKTNGGYPYDHWYLLVAAVLLPIIFGGAIGPAAGLVSLTAAIWTFISQQIKLKWQALSQLAQPGLGARLALIFSLGPGNAQEAYTITLPKTTRSLLYAIGLGTLLIVLNVLVITCGSMTLPRFDRFHAVGWSQWKWALLLLAFGILLGVIYEALDKLTRRLAGYLMPHIVLVCIVIGAVVGLAGYYLPQILFAGSTQLLALVGSWTELAAGALLALALLKVMLSVLCLNLGWRGGPFMPMIYSGVAAGFGVTVLIDQLSLGAALDGSFAAAIVVAAMLGYCFKKPVLIIVLLLLCFPLTYIVPLTASAFASAKIAEWAGKKRAHA